jgi:hypothetical protein
MRTAGSARNVVAQALRIDLSPGVPPSPCTAAPERGGLLPADSREQAFMRRTCLVTAIMGRAAASDCQWQPKISCRRHGFARSQIPT